MARRIKETPPGMGGVSLNTGDDRFERRNTLEALRAQILIVKAGVRPELAATLAGFAFGGGAHG